MLTIEFFEKFTTDQLLVLSGIIQQVISDREACQIDMSLPIKIQDSDISGRCCKVLNACKINYWYELAQYTKLELFRFRNLGRHTHDEIVDQMRKRKIEFKEVS